MTPNRKTGSYIGSDLQGTRGISNKSD